VRVMRAATGGSGPGWHAIDDPGEVGDEPERGGVDECVPGSAMIHITPQMRVQVAIEPVDFRCVSKLADSPSTRPMGDQLMSTILARVYRVRGGNGDLSLVF
jgi:hypothetical protein